MDTNGNQLKNGNMEMWAAALESGKYLQGFGNLRYRNSYCPLGVACDLYQETFGGLVEQLWINGLSSYNGHYAFPPRAVTWWLGLSDHDLGHIIYLNDDEGKSFPQIAAAIRQMVEVHPVQSGEPSVRGKTDNVRRAKG